MPHDGSGHDRPKRRIAVGRVDTAAKLLGLGIGLLLGFFVLNLAHAPGSLERQADRDAQDMLRAEAGFAAPDSEALANPF